jgi:hypothetical protein
MQTTAGWSSPRTRATAPATVSLARTGHHRAVLVEGDQVQPLALLGHVDANREARSRCGSMVSATIPSL